jgi:FdhD protein
MQSNLSRQAATEGAVSVAVSGWRNGLAFETTDAVAIELPVALEYNGISHAVMLATPCDLEDFGLGFSLTEHIVKQLGQIYGTELVTTDQGIMVRMEIAAACMAGLKERRRSMAGRTGCGLCGTDNLAQAVRPAPAVPTGAPFSAQAVAHGLQTLRAGQHLNETTGATHAAAWCDRSGNLQCLREDVGRHNALDKLIGALARAGQSPQDGFLVITSRASYEMVHKSAAWGAGLLAAVSGVTQLAVKTAAESGLCLMGFVRGTQCSVYSHSEFVMMDLPHE